MADRPACPRPAHKGWDHPVPLDRILERGGGWACPGILPDGAGCGYEIRPAAVSAALTGEDLAAAASVAAQMYADGIAEGLRRARTPEAGFDVGFDVGYAANLEDRQFVHAVRRGFDEGCAARLAWSEAARDAERESARLAALAARPPQGSV
jgi:hypothetical protein